MSWTEKTPASDKIPFVTGAVALIAALWVAFSHPGSWEDDAYIFFRYAQNLAAGEGLAFNPGEPSFGTTSVLWTLLLGGFCRLTGLEAIVAAKILCAVLFSASVWILTRLAVSRMGRPGLALTAGLLAAACPPFVFCAVSGMEVALNAFLLCALAASYFLRGEKRYWAGGFLIGFLFLTRPENILLLPIWGVLFWPEPEGWRRKFFGLFLGFAAVALPWELSFYSHTGLFLPPTRTGKLLLFLPAQYGVTLEQFQGLGVGARLEIAFRAASYLFAAKNLLVFTPFLLLTGFYFLRGRIPFTRLWLAGGVYFLGLVTLFGFFFPLIKLRYFIHIYPFFVFAAALGCFHLWGVIRKKWPVFGHPFWVRAGFLLLILSVPLLGFLTARKFSHSCREQAIRTEIGLWLKTNTPQGARIALEPIGAVGYHSGRPVVDLGGLVQPEVWPYMKEGENSRMDSLAAFLERKRVDYIIDYSQHPWAGKVALAFPKKFERAAHIQSPYPPPGSDSYDVFKRRR